MAKYIYREIERINNKLSVQSGVTLVELLITVVIVGTLAAVAIPSYRSYVLKANRASAEGVLMEAAQFLERNYTTNNCYHRADGDCATARSSTDCDTDDDDEVSLDGYCVAPKEGEARYNINFSSISSQSYTLQAVPIATDSLCGTLTLTNTGVKGESGSGTVADCW